MTDKDIRLCPVRGACHSAASCDEFAELKGVTDYTCGVPSDTLTAIEAFRKEEKGERQ